MLKRKTKTGMEEMAEASTVARAEGMYLESQHSRGQPGLHTKTF